MTEVVGGGVGGRSSTPGVGRPGGRHQQRWWGGGSSPLVVVAVVAGRGHIVDIDGAGSGRVVDTGGGGCHQCRWWAGGRVIDAGIVVVVVVVVVDGGGGVAGH